MSRFSSDFLVAATGGSLRGSADFELDRIDKDSRIDLSGALYVALRGERFDGHDFVGGALSAGAVAAMVDEEGAAGLAQLGPLLVVRDTQQALLDLASAHLGRCAAFRVALTGSNGKTTTKEMIASILRRAFGQERIHATAGNLNNLIGLPLSALQVREETVAAVLEMGMNRPGEIRSMAEVVDPEIGLIVNVHPAHLEGLGSIEAVAAAKGELFDALSPNAVAVVNADDPHCVAIGARSSAQTLSFGSGGGADVVLESTVALGDGQQIRLALRGAAIEAKIGHPGRHNALNAAAAAACGLALELDPETIAAGLEAAPVVAGRLALRGLGPVDVIDDSYNANPASMRAALDVASQRAASSGQPLVVALGEMRELGPQSGQLHAELGGAVAAAAPRRAWFFGAFADDYRRGALEAGLDAQRVAVAADVGERAEEIAEELQAGELVLVKGSRGARMERVVERIAQRWARADEEGR